MWAGVFAVGMYIALCLSELIALFPKSGDLYIFSKEAYGNFTAFIVGWTTWIAGNIGASLAIVWALEYMFPVATTTAFLIKLAVAIGIIVLLNLITFFGISLSTVLLTGLAVMTLIVLTFQIIPFFINIPALLQGTIASSFSITNFSPFFMAEGWGPNGILLLATFFIISEAFIGMETITFLSAETKQPEKTIPKALIAAISTAAVVLILYVVGSISAFPVGEYARSLLPHKEILQLVWQGSLMPLLLGGTGIIILAPAVVWIVTGPRLLLSLGKDKLILPQLEKIHPKTKTPVNAIIFQSIIISLFTAFMYYLYIVGHHDPYKLFHEQFIMLVLFILSLTILAVPILRKKFPKAERPFKAPLGKIGPWIIVLIFLAGLVAYLSVGQEYHIVPKALTFIGIGIPVYFLLTLYYNPEATTKIYGSLSKVSKGFENITLPKKIRKRIANLFGEIQGKRVLDYGASIGTLTETLADKAGPTGYVYAIDFVKGDLKVLDERIVKKHIENVKTLHDEHMINRIHPEVNSVDMIFSVGSMDHIQDLHRVLKEMAFILPENGKICMVEYADFFGILPNSGTLSDLDKLQQTFKEAGFSVRIVKWKGGLWNYICIYGLKSDNDTVIV